MKLAFRVRFLGVEWITVIRIMFSWRALGSIPLARAHPKELPVVRPRSPFPQLPDAASLPSAGLRWKCTGCVIGTLMLIRG